MPRDSAWLAFGSVSPQVLITNVRRGIASIAPEDHRGNPNYYEDSTGDCLIGSHIVLQYDVKAAGRESTLQRSGKSKSEGNFVGHSAFG